MSAIGDQTAQMVAAINGFAQVLPGALAAKAQEAAQADNASALQNNTPSQVSTSLDAELTAHLAASPDPHGLTLTQAGVYSQAQVNAKFAPPLIPNAALPISRYGELNYLPVGVSGSFEGASSNQGNSGSTRWFPSIVEDDGTWMFLRNGTDGGSVGVYYAYMKNAMAGSLSSVVRTNKRYQPTYFPDGNTAQFVWKSDGACIWGQLQDANGNAGNYFLSITDGTFDATNHKGCFFTPASVGGPPTTTNYPEGFVGTDGNVYLLVPTANARTSPMDFNVYRISLADATSGNTITPTKLTNWTTTGFGGVQYTQPAIRLAAQQCAAAGNNAMSTWDQTNLPSATITMYHGNANGMDLVSAQDPSSTTIRTRVSGLVSVTNNNTGIQLVCWTIFTFTWDPVAMTAQVEAAYQTPANLTLAANGAPQLTGSFVFTTKTPYSPSNAQSHDNLYYHPAGYWFSCNDQAIADSDVRMYRATVNTSAKNKFQAVQVLATSSTISGSSSAAYGSAIGGTLLGSWQLPNNRVMVSASGANQAGQFQRDLVLATRGASGWTYKSLTNGSYQGYAPSSFRFFLSDLGIADNLWYGMMSEIDINGNVNATGNSFIEGLITQGFVSCNGNLVTSGTTSIDATLAQSLKSQILSQAGQSGITSAYISIFVPQNTSIPPFAVVEFLLPTGQNNLCTVLAELSITAGSRTGSITGMSVVSVSSVYQGKTFTTSLTIDATYSLYTGGLTIYEASDCWMIGGCGKTRGAGSGFTMVNSYRFAIPKSTNRPDWSTFVGVSQWADRIVNYHTAVPGVGFGYNFQQSLSTASSDFQTKLLFVPVATNLAQFKAWSIPAASSWLVQVSQVVAQGWSVYFTDNTPAILNGQFTNLPPVTFNLSSIKTDPTNTTFYVYLTTDLYGFPWYTITPTPQAETASTMYLGKIVTGATSIESINVQKVTCLDLYRFSGVSQGSAVSVSTGTPDAPSSLNWT